MSKLIKILIFTIGINLALTTLSEGSDLSHKAPSGDVYDLLRLFSKVISTIEKLSFRNPDIKNLIFQAIKSVTKDVDAHSAFLEDFDQIAQGAAGAFPGIGVSVLSKNQDDDFLILIDVIEESPAQKAGLKPADRIIAVNEEKVKGLSTDEVVNKMKGVRGTKVKLRIIRAGKPMEFEVTRDTIIEQSSNGYYLPQQEVYYFSLKMFSERSTAQLKGLLNSSQSAQKCKGVILDLRDNPGGVLEAAIEIASLFLPSNQLVVSTINGKNTKTAQYKTSGAQIYNPNIPLFILTNNFTASAAELLAASLRYYSIAEDEKLSDSPRKAPMVFILGNQTHGKGSVQEVIPLGNGCALKLTTLLYLLPDDSSIQEIGVTPDITIPYKSAIQKEVQWMLDMFGSEKSLKKHITQTEVQQVKSGAKPDLSSKFDAETEKARREIEYKEQQLEESSSPETLKLGDIERSKEEVLTKNYLVSVCLNMITMLDYWSKSQKGKQLTRQNALEFIKKNFAIEGSYKVDKI